MSTRASTIVVVASLSLALALGVLLWVSSHSGRRLITVSSQTNSANRTAVSLPKVLAAKDKTRLAAAAQRIALATVMHWYGQTRFMDGTVPGTMTIPSDCFAEASLDPKLAAWMTAWRHSIKKGEQATAANRDSLEIVLKESPLPCPALLDIGRAVDFLSNDHNTTARFYAAAAYAGAREAAAVKSEPLRYRALLLGLNSTRPLFWEVIDDSGKSDFAPALKVVCDTVSQWKSGSDSILDSDCKYARIDAAECLLAEGKAKEAVDSLNLINYRGLNSEQRLNVDWAIGASLFSDRQYSDAIPSLQSVVDSSAHHREDAMRLLVLSLAQSNRHDEARRQLNSFVAVFRPTTDEILKLRNEIDSAELAGLPSKD